jgi:hypothetical protein
MKMPGTTRTTTTLASAGLDGHGIRGPLLVDVAHPARVLAGTTDGSILAIDLPR